MLKDNATSELIGSIGREVNTIDWVVMALVCLGVYILSDGMPTGWQYLGILVLIVLSQIISALLTLFLIAWLGRIRAVDAASAWGNTQHSEVNAKKYLESWWQNERTIKFFLVVFRVAFCLGIYRAFAVSPGGS